MNIRRPRLRAKATPFDMHTLYARMRRPFRERRMRLFVTRMGITSESRVPDVGGSPEIWKLCPVRPRLTLLNIRGYDGAALRRRRCAAAPSVEGAFDVVFSNSLIGIPSVLGCCSRMSVVE